MFEEEPTIWDYNRGRPLPDGSRVEATDIDKLAELGTALRQSTWRQSTRVLYNGYFRAWLFFAMVNGCAIMPAKRRWLELFLTWMALHYAAGTVTVAAAAVVAMHAWNNFPHPFKGDAKLKQILGGIESCGICGARAPKYIVDSTFVVRMAELFLEDYPFFCGDWFDPWRRDGSQSVIWLRAVALVLVGLELGVRPSSLARLTTCCWQQRLDNTVAVQVDLAKNVKNGQVFHVVLERRPGRFKDNFSAVSFMEEFVFPLMEAQGQLMDCSRCDKTSWRTSHCRQCPFLFASWGKRQPEGVRQPAIRASEVSDSVKKWAVRLGREAKNYSGKSLRRGSQSIAAARMVARRIRKAHGGWKSERMPDIYTEISKKSQKQVGRAIYKTVQRTKKNRNRKVEFAV